MKKIYQMHLSKNRKMSLVWCVLPQGRSVCDGEQGDVGNLGSLENLSLYVNAHSAGTLIQQGIFRPNIHGGNCFNIAGEIVKPC